jgi:hypothetical protein
MSGDGEGTEKHRQAHLDQNRVGSPAAAGHARVDVAREGPARQRGIPQRIQANRTRAPFLPRSPQPERGNPASDGFDPEPDRIAAIHHAAVRGDPNRRHHRSPGARRMPERGSGTTHRPRRGERDQPHDEDSETRQADCSNRPRDRLDRRAAAPLDLARLRRIGLRQK